MPFEFRRAERTTTSMLIALAGSSGAGKTYTAISLGLGLSYPGMTPAEILATIEREGRCRLVVLDSEGGRALHYAPKPGQAPDFVSSFPFEYAELLPPFTPKSYEVAVVAANDAGFAAVVVDSTSHEYEGEGGVLEWADRLAAGVPKPGVASPDAWRREDWIEQPVKSPGNWKEPKRAHKMMMARLLQCRLHMIFCLRAEEKMQLVQEKYTGRDGKERSSVKVIPAEDRPINERWEPICEKRFMYEMTASFVLVPSDPGVGIPLKLQEQHRHCFPEGQKIGPESGRLLAAWASGVGEPQTRQSAVSGQPAGNSTSGDPEQQREAWMVAYIERVKATESLDALRDLQTEKAEALNRFREGDPVRWAKITEAHGAAFERLDPFAS
jgi:hypothetical protein